MPKVAARRLPLFVQVAVSVALIYGLSWRYALNPDLRSYNFDWLSHIRAAGGFSAAFSASFGNYTPPYLYLLALVSPLGLSPLATIKLISVGGSLFLGLCVWRLMPSEKSNALVALLLPTVVLNGPLLGQCDAIWVGFCVLAVAAALEKRVYMMALWAACGFAFKAQAAFIAPFCLIVMLNERKWLAALIPPFVYLAAVVPAWAAGWPAGNLLTVYGRQLDFQILSSAPNLWALPSVLLADWRHPPSELLVAGYVAGVVGLAWYLYRWPKPSLRSALLISILLPFLLSKMHERYFLLGDVLALCLACRDQSASRTFIYIQAGSLLAYISYLWGLTDFRVAGSIPMAFALAQLLRECAHEAKQHASAPEPADLEARGGRVGQRTSAAVP